MHDNIDSENQHKSAISIELDIAEGGGFTRMILRANGLYVVTEDKILRLRPPEMLDRECNHNDVLCEQSLVMPLGTKTPIVARALIQSIQLFEICFPERSKEYGILVDISWEVMNSLVSLKVIKDRLEQQVNKITEIVAQSVEIYTQGVSPKPMPAVEYYDIEFRSFVNEVKRCLNTISDLFPVLTALKFGVKHSSFKNAFGRGHFQKAQAWAESVYGQGCLLAQMLKGDLRWIEVWIGIRNSLEHPTREKYVETLNFSLEPDRNVRLPTWRFVHPEFDMDRPQNLLQVFEICMNNLLKLYEDLLLVLMHEHIPNMLKIEYIEIAEENRDPNCPLRYYFRAMSAFGNL